VSFIRSSALTDSSFKDLVNSFFNQNFLTATACKSWLTANGYWTSWGSLPAGMVLYLDAGLTSSYPGSGSTWYDLSGNNNHGTIIGATYSSSQGGVLGFDGSNDYVSFGTVSNIPIGNDNYTVSIWFNTTSSDTTGGFFGWGAYNNTNQVNAFRLLANGAGFVNYWWANDQEFNTTVDPDTWYNVVAKFDGANREIWLNGVLVGSVAPSPGHNVPYADNLTIGLTAPELNEYFPGKIGQVVFYRRGATDQEIQDIYNSGLDRFTNNNTPPPSTTSFLITVTNDGSNVLMIGTGSVNLTDLSLVATNQGPATTGGIGINSATFISGASGQYFDEYGGFLTTPSNFGSGSGFPPSSVSGSLFGVIYQGAPPHHLIVPTGYTSSTQITTSQTFNSTTLATLGLTPGTYSYTWGTGSNADIITVVIGGTSSSGGGGGGGTSSGATGSWLFYQSNEGPVTAGAPRNAGNAIFVINGGTYGTYNSFNPNKVGSDNKNLYFNVVGNNNTSYITPLTNLKTYGGTISIAQGANAVTYTLSPNVINFDNGTYSQVGTYSFIALPTQGATMVASASTSFTYGTSIDLNILPTGGAGGGGGTGSGWEFYYNEGALGGTPPPINDGEILFFDNTNQTMTYNPNYPGGGVSFQILINENQSDGSSSLSAFNTLDSSGGTIAISQGSNTVIYSGGAGVYFVQNFGGSNTLIIDVQTATLVQAASAPFVSGTPITISIS
jgi:hypothetical protein